MGTFASPAGTTIRDVEWLHWMFVRDGQVISCGVDARGDGLYTVSLLRLWATDEHVTETFVEPGDALRRHAQIARFLQASGWLIASGGVVKVAA